MAGAAAAQQQRLAKLLAEHAALECKYALKVSTPAQN